MKYLVTGGAGFLGTALSNRLAKQGHYVRVLDDCSAGNPASLLPEVEFTRGDINEKTMLWKLMEDGLRLSPCGEGKRARVSAFSEQL